ncbi:hypothetical protein MPTK1_5g15050 [Marchantia polymorpha subsp. ruderalis]|uniref:Uncharacterized protein n=2 Tax=Marchantia polymorpha TaxID=3197 RepID=A0AAF6BIJ0_MARPO|nr:hypothetical protein MARPO_0071s0104 [Marchantia polymorpha]BBN11824.1 hypothetical protein Mp_5g15050 [Marchantia polymorpha subsp. ruderalis]|eukprot:PTQ35497.1 hypothetical protein MARPO_0071s0104 [Marchantia polymorpha]
MARGIISYSSGACLETPPGYINCGVKTWLKPTELRKVRFCLICFA